MLASFGISLFRNTKIGILLLFTHILAGISVGVLFGKLFAEKRKNNIKFYTKDVNNYTFKEAVTLSNFGKILGKSIQNAISTILMIGGFIIFFSVIISILINSHIIDYFCPPFEFLLYLNGFNINFAKPIFSGMIELTNGISAVAKLSVNNINANIILCAFLLGFGGISVLLQVCSLISKTDLSIRKYFYGKLLQGILAAAYTIIALTYIPILN